MNSKPLNTVTRCPSLIIPNVFIIQDETKSFKSWCQKNTKKTGQSPRHYRGSLLHGLEKSSHRGMVRHFIWICTKMFFFFFFDLFQISQKNSLPDSDNKEKHVKTVVQPLLKVECFWSLCVFAQLPDEFQGVILPVWRGSPRCCRVANSASCWTFMDVSKAI